jgi:phosphoglycolate phosphatase
MHLVASVLPIVMSARPWKPPSQVAVLWDVDGTLVESTKLAFDATNEVLVGAGQQPVTLDDYKVGCRYTTPERFNFHLGLETGDLQGAKLGQIFDSTYVARVSPETAGLFNGLEPLLRSLSMNGHPQGALSNACGEYVRAVMAANLLDEVPGQRLAVMKVAKGADEVPAAKPQPDGLIACCGELGVEPTDAIYVGDSPSDGKAAAAAGMRSIGVLWGAAARDKLEGNFDVLADDVPGLTRALQGFLLPKD